MPKAEASILIESPPEQIYEFIAVDFIRNYRRWSPEVQRLDLLTPGPLRIGSRARQVRTDYGRRSESTFRVVAMKPASRISFAEIAGRFTVDYRLETVHEQTRLTFAFDLKRLELVMRPFREQIRVAMQESAERVVANIKGLVEAEAQQRGTSELG
jgi:hypothetical protein